MIQLSPKQSYLLLGAAVAISGAVGFLIGRKVGAQGVYDDFDAAVDEASANEIEAARVHYARLYKRDEYSDPSTLVDTDPPVWAEGEEEEYREVAGELTSIVNNYTNGEPQTVNIFVNGQPLDQDFDYEAEQAKRDEDPDRPYVISHDEFMVNEPENDQGTLTYFEGDSILSDERDQPIDNEDELVGSDNLSRFGHGSNDNNVVYVRNDKFGLDYEIVRSTGSYAEEVAGLTHSDDTIKIRKFRSADE